MAKNQLLYCTLDSTYFRLYSDKSISPKQHLRNNLQQQEESLLPQKISFQIFFTALIF
jgi:hypothetical protein